MVIMGVLGAVVATHPDNDTTIAGITLTPSQAVVAGMAFKPCASGRRHPHAGWRVAAGQGRPAGSVTPDALYFPDVVNGIGERRIAYRDITGGRVVDERADPPGG